MHALATALLKSTGGSTFPLVAHDWGGVVAWVYAAQHPEMLDRLVILNAPHPSLFGSELRENPAQQKASEYMLMFRSQEAEALLSENQFEWLKRAVLGGNASQADEDAYVEAWSQPGALTGGLNYYRASGVGPPPSSASSASSSGAPSAASAATANTLSAAPMMIVRVPRWSSGARGHGAPHRQFERPRPSRAEADREAHPRRHALDPREKAADVNRLIREFLSQPGADRRCRRARHHASPASLRFLRAQAQQPAWWFNAHRDDYETMSASR